MICLSKILEDNVRFGMIRFRKLFEMIFRFGNASPSKIQAIWFSLSHPPYLRPENHLFSMIRKMKYLTDMIRGKSPSASEMRKRAGHREEGSSRRAPRSFRKEDTLCHFKKMGRSHSEKRSHKSKRKSKTNPNAVPKWKSYLSFENDDSAIIPKWLRLWICKTICDKSVRLSKGGAYIFIPKWEGGD